MKIIPLLGNASEKDYLLIENSKRKQKSLATMEKK
jgi:hypothetical protein